MRAMRIAVLADLHANLPALLAVLDDAAALGCDALWCVGDVVGRGPHPAEVVDELQALDALVVQGNWDEAVGQRRDQPGAVWSGPQEEAVGLASLEWTIARCSDDQRAWLRQLPQTERLSVEDRSVLLFHGSPLRQNEYLWASRPSRVFARVSADEGDDLLCFGHTHEAFHRPVGKSHFVAAGSVGCGAAEDRGARYAVIDLAGPDLAVNFRSVPYDDQAVEAAMRAAGLAPSLLWAPPPQHADRDAESEELVGA
jgi:putative phosphoesterase